MAPTAPTAPMAPLAPMRARWRVPWARACLVALLAVGGCGRDAEPSADERAIAEPEDALRPAAQRGAVPADARVVDYRIEARLDADTHEVHGILRAAWRNRTAQSVRELPMHLYMNGFRAEDTAWMASARGSHRGESFARDRWGFVHVERVDALARFATTELPEDILEHDHPGPIALAFAEDADPSTMTVSLDAPVEPGQSIVVELEFVTRLPRVFARTGYAGDFHMVGQWFPKLGVLEADGWKTHTFTLFSEFYADFGHYDVHLDVPERFVVGATGVRVTEPTIADGRKHLHYRAEMVHDFAWAADPEFVERYGDYQGVRIRQLIQPEHAHEAPAHLEVQREALASMEARFGPYPWSTLTIVHPPERAGGAMGMEYPTLFTTSDIELDGKVPSWVVRERVTGRFTTVHEFGHQYFQGMFASNEYAQPWLDEGLNTASNYLVYWDAYGEDPWMVEVLGNPLTSKDLTTLQLMFEADRDPIDQPADRWHPLAHSYGATTYGKTSAVLLTLRELVGREPFDAAMARYAREARFRHPTGADLEAILVETIGGHVPVGHDGVALDVADYLDQGLRSTMLADFRVAEVGNRRRLGDAGWHGGAGDQPDLVARIRHTIATLFDGPPTTGPEGWRLTPSPDDWGEDVSELADDRVEGYVVVHRRSGFRVPVDVEVEFADGSRVRRTWDGQDARAVLTFPGQRVVLARVDPDYTLLIEPRRNDNARVAYPEDDAPDDALAEWVGHAGEAANLTVLGGLGL